MFERGSSGKRIAGWVAFYVLVVAASIVVLRAEQDLREEFHQTYPLAAGGRVSLHNVNGSVHVTAWDQNQVKVDAVKRARTQEALKEVEIVVEARADAVEIRTKYPEHSGLHSDSASVDYTLSVPRQARLDEIKTVNGAIEIAGTAAEVRAGSVNGGVTGRQLTGEVELSTVNGRVEAEVDRLAGKPISLKSVNGAVALRLPQDAGARLSASTVHGSIDSDFDLTVRHIGFGPGRDVETVIGKGGPDVKLRTVNGSIRLVRR